MLSLQEKNDLLNQYVQNNFIHLLDAKIFSSIYDSSSAFVICTTRSANYVGNATWEEGLGLSMKDYADEKLLKKFFKDAYNEQTKDEITLHLKRIYEIQQFVINEHKVVSFFDLLPWNNTFKSFLVTYIPIYHTNKQVIGMQSFSVDSRFLSFQEHMNFEKAEVVSHKDYQTEKSLTPRELEIMFLLANGVTQEQIAQILGISRGTVAAIIGNQLCVKFGIPGSSTKLLAQVAIKNGYYQYVPRTLWKPSVIILEEEFAIKLQP